MKLERLHEYVTTVTAILIGIAISYWFGLLAGEGSIGIILAALAGFVFTALLLALRENVWVLVPICWPLSDALPKVRINPGLRDVVIVAVLVSVFVLTAVKAIRRKPVKTAIDFWLWAVLLDLFVTYLRHPTGGLILKSDRIGGRAYLTTAFAIVAYYILARASIPRHWKPATTFRWVIACYLIQGTIETLRAVLPQRMMGMNRLYGREVAPTIVDPSAASGTNITPERLGYMQTLATPLLRWQIAVYRPLTLVNPLYLGRFLVFSLSIFLCMLAGFRSGVITVGAYMIIASYLRKGAIEVMRYVFLGLAAVMAAIALSYFVQLPLSVQRSLSFLPGRWDPAAVANARHSSEWRFRMWQLMLTEDRYIESKWFGDGFGFSMQQFSLMQNVQGQEEGQETFMFVGQVHSGPISTIRFVGYVGLALYLCLLVTMALEATRLCRETMGTDLGPLTWLFRLPIIWEPFNFVLIFGSYDYALPLQIYYVGLLKMLRNSLDARQAETPAETPVPRRVLPVARPGVRRSDGARRPMVARPRLV